jgi:tetratricopeptide (TPR) repeat protein
MKQLKFDDARAAFGSALRAAPDFVPAMEGLGGAERSMGHSKEALDVYRSCLSKSPFAESCLEDQQGMYATSGECNRAKSDAEAWVEMDPTSVRARLALGDALQATGTPYEGVKEALSHAVEVAPPAQKALTQASTDASLALIQGRFEDAMHAAKLGEDALPPSANRLTRAYWVVRRVLIALEIGDDATAADLSKGFVARMDAYPKAPLDMDPDIDFYEPMYRAKAIDRAKFDSLRRAWIQKELDALRGTEVATQTARMPWLWVKAWAQSAETEDEAKEALALVSSFGQMIPEEQSPTRLNFTIGRVLALAGRSDEAISRLLHMTRACTELNEPQAWIRAHYYLGVAYESKHDIPKAREAYGLVVERWGSAKTSVTAKAAKERLLKLGR